MSSCRKFLFARITTERASGALALHRPFLQWAAYALALGAFLTSLQAIAQSAASGKHIFTSKATPACAVCHTLADAGAEGEIGPNLDDLKPSADRVRAAVRSGVGAMPGYAGDLAEDEIAAVAQYVARATRK